MKNKIKKILNNEGVKKAFIGLLTAIVVAIAAAMGLTSCNVTRTITTESSSLQKGDTSVIIQTKTIESYNAKKI